MNLDEARMKMTAAVDWLRDQLSGIVPLKGAAQSSLIETIKIGYLGQHTPLKHVARIGAVKDSISIEPFDPSPQLLKSIEKACQESGFNAYVFSKTQVLASRPPYDAQTRRETIARVKKVAEDARVSVRNIRKNAKKTLNAPSKDELQKNEKALQQATDDAISEIDSIVERKINILEGRV